MFKRFPCISVIVPVHNEEEMIKNCLDALLNQDYPRHQYEIIVVNDGSTDDTAKEVSRKKNVKLINLLRNQGRIEARIAGSREAIYENLLFIDSRRIAPPDLLSKLVAIDYQPIIAKSLKNTKKNPYERVLDLLRLAHYQHKPDESYWVREENFDHVGKGTGCLFISKALFLRCQPELRDRYVNDDTKILREVVRERPIWVDSSIKVEYMARRETNIALWHLFERGPRFQDYYLQPGSLYYTHWRLTLAIAAILLTFLILFPFLWLYYIFLVIFALLFTSAWLASNVQDFKSCLIYLPQILLAFGTGILYGKIRAFFYHLTSKYNNTEK